MSTSENRSSAQAPGIKHILRGAGLAAFALLGPISAAHAGGTIKFGDGQSVTIGFGLRTSFDAVENAAPSGSDWSKDFKLDSGRLYVSGTLTPHIKGTLNSEIDNDGNYHLLDGYAQLEINDGLNFWAGRMLPPSDRSNLDGPYYISSWSYPGVASRYPAIFAGRDDGVTMWGKLDHKRLTYAVGVYKGFNATPTGPNQSDDLLYAGRVAFNFWDVEDNPAYYTSSTYYGAANVFTVAFAAQYQPSAAGTPVTKGDFFGWNVDALLEKKVFDGGAVTLEGAYYKYDTDDILDTTGTFSQGDSYLASAAFLFPKEVGWGKFQPVARYQKFNNDFGADTERTDFGVNYVIKGHNARLSLAYGINKTEAAPDYDDLTIGLQIQY